MSQVLESPLEAGRDAVLGATGTPPTRFCMRRTPRASSRPTISSYSPRRRSGVASSSEYMDANERAYKAYVEAGNLARAAYIATLLAHDNGAQLQTSVASGWLSRAKRHLDETEEAPEHGY